jgi:hypothetical protein
MVRGTIDLLRLAIGSQLLVVLYRDNRNLALYACRGAEVPSGRLLCHAFF